jgi:hypothetical protein
MTADGFINADTADKGVERGSPMQWMPTSRGRRNAVIGCGLVAANAAAVLAACYAAMVLVHSPAGDATVYALIIFAAILTLPVTCVLGLVLIDYRRPQMVLVMLLFLMTVCSLGSMGWAIWLYAVLGLSADSSDAHFYLTYGCELYCPEDTWKAFVELQKQAMPEAWETITPAAPLENNAEI